MTNSHSMEARTIAKGAELEVPPDLLGHGVSASMQRIEDARRQLLEFDETLRATALDWEQHRGATDDEIDLAVHLVFDSGECATDAERYLSHFVDTQGTVTPGRRYLCSTASNKLNSLSKRLRSARILAEKAQGAGLLPADVAPTILGQIDALQAVQCALKDELDQVSEICRQEHPVQQAGAGHH